MRMRFPLFAIAAASVFAASCTSDKDLYDENYQNEVEKATYEQNFIKKFGAPAATQDFNAVENYQINVEASASKNIKIYAPSQNGVSKLVADYAISGNQTISFAAPEGTEVVYVVDDNGQVQAVNPKNGTVSLTSRATRGVTEKETENVVIGKAKETCKEFANSFTRNTYLGLVSKTNEWTVFYTKGAKSAQKDGVIAVGIYYYDQNGQKIDVETWTPDAETLSNGNVSYGFTVKIKNQEGPIYWGLWMDLKDVEGRVYDYGTNDGTPYGKYNAHVDDLVNREGVSVLGFDLDDNDNYGDEIFIINKSENEIIDPTAFSYVLACEDLGNTDDFDFNDVVFSASYVAGRKIMTVKPLAAGGTLNSTISYKDKEIGEIHDLLGAPSNTIYNTTSFTDSGTETYFEVPESFDLKAAMNDFVIQVVDGDKATRKITLPKGNNKIPQVICVPGDWFWPTERTEIGDAYKNFTKWVQAQHQEDGIEWWKPTYVSGKVVVR
ncbi:MAG: LruC domain-containing protein [Bacteroidaceae bacterium]|nr:LruC domain-containing protein [Bacteroidaceae bacterium]